MEFLCFCLSTTRELGISEIYAATADESATFAAAGSLLQMRWHVLTAGGSIEKDGWLVHSAPRNMPLWLRL